MSPSAALIRSVLHKTTVDLERARQRRGSVKEQLLFSIYFARHFGASIAAAFHREFGAENVASGEVASGSSEGAKRVDVSYSTKQSGLGFMVSLKSVHQGERDAGNARFTHNLKRNDEELRVEATTLHLRQPYAVLVAAMILPFEACSDAWTKQGGEPTSSFARWVEKFWALKGRTEPEDPPNQFELVFIVLYARDGSEIGFYEVGGQVPCPRRGRPASLLDFDGFVQRIRETYYKRNRRDFHFAGEPPVGGPATSDDE
jgi:hypothetical protein